MGMRGSTTRAVGLDRVLTSWCAPAGGCVCLQQSELLRVSERNPLLAPLRFALPLRDFANVSIAVTGYKEGAG